MLQTFGRGEHDGEVVRAGVRGRACGDCGELARLRLVLRTRSDEENARGGELAVRVDGERLPGFALETFLGGETAEQTVEPLVERGDVLVLVLVLFLGGNGDGEEIALELDERATISDELQHSRRYNLRRTTCKAFRRVRK